MTCHMPHSFIMQQVFTHPEAFNADEAPRLDGLHDSDLLQAARPPHEVHPLPCSIPSRHLGTFILPLQLR